MDKKTATSFVERIEAHRREEESIWQEMRDLPDYKMHEDKVVASIIAQRKSARDLIEESEADLGSFDWVEDDEGNLIQA